MSNPPDDLEAVRTIAETLEPFDTETRERVIRWAREKLGLTTIDLDIAEEDKTSSPKHNKDIKTFVAEKNPTTDTQFAATVAYYFKFEAPKTDRKDSISADDLQEACRKTDRDRLKKPIWTLNNAYGAGFLDRAGEKGKFTINTVGENLVAITLPRGAAQKITSGKKISKKAIAKRTRKTRGK